MTRVDEIAPEIFRISTFIPEAGLQFNQLGLAKTSSGRVSPVRVVAAWQSDPEERLHDEIDGEVRMHERNSDK